MYTYIGITVSLLLHLFAGFIINLISSENQISTAFSNEAIVVRLTTVKERSSPFSKDIQKSKRPQENQYKKLSRPLPLPIFDQQILSYVSPEYPAYAIKKSFEGSLTLGLEILSSGAVGSIQIKKSSGHDILDNAALKAASLWRFKKSSRPTHLNKEIIFKLN